ncbi:hypothetical protein [Actinoplanes sp. N902-109]|uniref:hypothetical protein n=1 Tax=Actinoplanes sp. (strain N902-109) TaxID=649831 RepID=UPI000329619A|nr:hypothetical protein [Actinoplanes sp. N902-109]AGL19479.1 hypothetical protein L083_5969 [Actinoplanes sp. N902-109]
MLEPHRRKWLNMRAWGSSRRSQPAAAGSLSARLIAAKEWQSDERQRAAAFSRLRQQAHDLLDGRDRPDLDRAQ